MGKCKIINKNQMNERVKKTLLERERYRLVSEKKELEKVRKI